MNLKSNKKETVEIVILLLVVILSYLFFSNWDSFEKLIKSLLR